MISSMRCSTFLTNPGLRLNPKRVFFENASVLSNPYMPAIMKRFLFLSFLLAYTFSSFAQELNVTVKINVNQYIGWNDWNDLADAVRRVMLLMEVKND